jgi:hypothetical protein
MNTNKEFSVRNALVWAMCLNLITLGCLPAANATVIDTPHFSKEVNQEVGQGLNRTAAIDRINSLLARDSVRQQMVALGVDPRDAQARVAALTDSELQTLDRQIGDLPAGGDILALVGVVFVVLLILELVGVINIFKKF